MIKIASVVLLILCLDVSAQFYDAGTWYYSFSAGGVVSFLSHQYTFNSEELDIKAKINFSAGGNLHYRITKDISLFGGVYLLRAGGNYGKERFNAPSFRHFSMNYIQIPAGLQFQPDRWLFEAGGYVSYMLNSRVSIHRDEMMGNTSINLFNDTNPIDAGVLAGVGYSFQLDYDAMITAGLRYYQGLVDVFAPDFARLENNYKSTFHQVYFIYLQAIYGF
ncbi:MAG: porin family protein [Thermaurantimonas sp.]